MLYFSNGKSLFSVRWIHCCQLSIFYISQCCPIGLVFMNQDRSSSWIMIMDYHYHESLSSWIIIIMDYHHHHRSSSLWIMIMGDHHYQPSLIMIIITLFHFFHGRSLFSVTWIHCCQFQWKVPGVMFSVVHLSIPCEHRIRESILQSYYPTGKNKFFRGDIAEPSVSPSVRLSVRQSVSPSVTHFPPKPLGRF